VVKTSWSKHEFVINLSKERIRTSPKWEPAELINTEFADKMHNHYNWPTYSNY
jgi:hypothetical protein